MGSLLSEFDTLEICSEGGKDEAILVAAIDLTDLLQAYQEDRPDDEAPTPLEFKMAQAEEVYGFCNSIAALQPLNTLDDSDPVLRSLQKEVAELKPHIYWLATKDSKEQHGIGAVSQSPTASPPRKRYVPNILCIILYNSSFH